MDIIAESSKIIDPEPTGDTMLVMTRVKVNARFAWRLNDQKVRIMHIYPKDNAKTSERVQILKGKLILVHKEVIQSDGGVPYWCIAGSLKRYGTTLYVRKQDTKKAG